MLSSSAGDKASPDCIEYIQNEAQVVGSNLENALDIVVQEELQTDDEKEEEGPGRKTHKEIGQSSRL